MFDFQSGVQALHLLHRVLPARREHDQAAASEARRGKQEQADRGVVLQVRHLRHHRHQRLIRGPVRLPNHRM